MLIPFRKFNSCLLRDEGVSTSFTLNSQFSGAEDNCRDRLLVIKNYRTRRITIFTKPIRTSSKPTGKVQNINQINPPVPLLSSHIDPPWKMEVI